MYVRADGGPAGAPDAFARLETALGGPRGRRFLGWLKDGEYRACAVVRPGEDPAAYGLAKELVPGGAYARARHEGPFARLPETFRALERLHRVDATRPDLEDYRSRDEVFALLPVLAEPS